MSWLSNTLPQCSTWYTLEVYQSNGSIGASFCCHNNDGHLECLRFSKCSLLSCQKCMADRHPNDTPPWCNSVLHSNDAPSLRSCLKNNPSYFHSWELSEATQEQSCGLQTTEALVLKRLTTGFARLAAQRKSSPSIAVKPAAVNSKNTQIFHKKFSIWEATKKHLRSFSGDADHR